MKKSNYKIIFCVLLAAACKAPQVSETDQNQIEESYVYDFKINYFRKLLREGFNNSDAIRNVLASDHSGYGEPILSEDDQKLIDSLVKIDNKNMVSDSLKRIGTVAEGAQGKHVLDYSLFKYQSKWLDSIAKARFQMYKGRRGE